MNQEENPPADTWIPLTLDIDLYLSLLDDEDIPDDQKREFIETLWSIMVSFVDLGFQIHPVLQSCGKDEASLFSLPGESQSVLNSRETKTNEEFSGAADDPTAPLPTRRA